MKRIFSIISFLLLCGLSLSAQPINKATPEANLKAAQEAESTNNPYEALNLYQKVYEETKDKALLVKMAKLQYDLRDYDRAEKAFNRIVTRDRKNEYPELKYWLAMSLKYNGKYAEAADMFNLYLTDAADENLKKSAKNELAGCELARKAKQPENLLINNIGKKANSPQTEGSPWPSGGELYYASIQYKDVIEPEKTGDEGLSKIYTAAKSKEGVEFGEPKALGEEINREGWHQGNVSITPDGKTMYFTRVELENNGVKTSQIYYSIKGADGWQGAQEVEGINGDYIAKHPCEGELFGEKVLFFVANLPGGEGGFDLYYASKKETGKFSLPVNLGKIINTPGDEASPYYRDGKLFFSSNGRPTIGGMDVFESQWNGTVWSAPKAMPLGINSSVDDQYYVQGDDPMTGYVVSNRPGPNNLKSKTCCDDIWAWELERVKVNLLAKTFRYKKKEEKANPALNGCSVQIFDVTDKNPLNVEQKINSAGNDFVFTLLPDRQYMLIAEKDGYIADTLTFNTLGIKKTPASPVEKKLILRAIPPKKPPVIVVKRDEPIRLNNIYYDYDDDKILPESEPDLQFLVNLMTKYPDMKIELSSHTDSRGRDEYNINLSQRRAESARRWMLAKGIAENRIVPKGYGETQLLNECKNGVTCSEEQHRYNRRTEFKIIEGPTSITIEEEIKPEEAPKEEKPAPKKPKSQNPGGNQSLRPLFFYRFQ